MYHYIGCGLPHVYLKNGYEIVKTPFGKGVTIHDLDGLHDALGSAIVCSPDPMSGDDFRFLRTELDLSQPGLGEVLGCDVQAIARWEKGKNRQVNAPAERLLRLLYKEAKMGDRKLASFLRTLQQQEREPVARKFVASERNDNWSAKALAL